MNKMLKLEKFHLRNIVRKCLYWSPTTTFNFSDFFQYTFLYNLVLAKLFDNFPF